VNYYDNLLQSSRKLSQYRAYQLELQKTSYANDKYFHVLNCNIIIQDHSKFEITLHNYNKL